MRPDCSDRLPNWWITCFLLADLLSLLPCWSKVFQRWHYFHLHTPSAHSRESTQLCILDHLTHPLLTSWLLSIPRWHVGKWKLFASSVFSEQPASFLFDCSVLLHHWLPLCPHLCSTPQWSAAPISLFCCLHLLCCCGKGGDSGRLWFTFNTNMSFPPLAATVVAMAHEGVFSLTSAGTNPMNRLRVN